MATFTNQAALSYNGITVNSNIVTGEITPTLEATKNATTTVYRAGDDLTYVVTLRNTGTLPFTGLTVTDDLGAYTLGGNTLYPLTYTGDPVLYYINGVLQTTPTTAVTQPLTISGISVPAGGDATIVYRATVNDLAQPGPAGSIVNTAAITGGGIAEAISASDTLTADTATRLAILKALDPLTVGENGEITYTFTIQNYGSAAETGANVVLRDVFNPILEEPLTVTLDGTELEEGSGYTYDETTGVFATVAGVITVPAATQTQDPTTGVWTITPAIATLTVTGTV